MEILDKQALKDLVGGNIELTKRLLKLFLENAPVYVKRVRDGINAANHEEVRKGAHALKGMSLNIAARPLSDIAFQLEDMGRKEDLSGAEDVCLQMEKGVSDLGNMIQEMLDSPAPF